MSKGSESKPGAPARRRRRPVLDSVSITPLPPMDPPSGPLPEITPLEIEATELMDAAPTGERPRAPRPRHSTEEIDTGVWDHRPRLGQRPAADARVIAGRYEVLEELPGGGMARVFKVKHIALGKVFALKAIRSRSAAALRIEQLFFREAEVASAMDHPNIVQVTDFGEDDELGAYIVMEYLQGETLHARLRRLDAHGQRLHEGAALEIGLQVAEALHYMHRQNVIHCDLKSENVFLCTSQAEHRRRTLVKLIDFGLSRRKSSGLQLAQEELAGTPEYMAPELLGGSSPQPAMDIYSLGVLFFEMLTGRLPFTGSMEEVIRKQVYEDPPALADLLDGPADERLLAFITKAMSKAPRRRQESMGQTIFELRTLLEMRDHGERRRARSGGASTGATVRPGHAPGADPGRRGERDEQKPASEDRAAASLRRLFTRCPLPLFQLDPKGRILSANPAFCHFVGLRRSEIVGRMVDTTRLAYVYPSIVQDVREAATDRRRSIIQRSLSFPHPQGGQPVPMMCWLTPDTDESGALVRFDGAIHPLQA